MREATFLTTREVAERLHVSVSTVARWVRAGYLNAIRLPGPRGRLRFTPEAVEEFETALLAGEVA